MDTRNSKVNAHGENEKVWMGAHVDTDTLIVWTETSGIDMALSFQEAEGCATIWLVHANPKYCVHELMHYNSGISLVKYNNSYSH